MKIENLTGELAVVFNRLFDICEELTGSRPGLSGRQDLYLATQPGGRSLYLEAIPRGGTKNPPQSIRMWTKWRDDLDGGSVLRTNRDHTGSGKGELASLTILVSNPDQVAEAEQFVRRVLAPES